METQVKERLTGAVILVALIVLLVPELLTGGPGSSSRPQPSEAVESTAEPAMRTVHIDLVDGGVRQAQPAEADLNARALPKPAPDPQANVARAGKPAAENMGGDAPVAQPPDATKSSGVSAADATKPVVASAVSERPAPAVVKPVAKAPGAPAAQPAKLAAAPGAGKSMWAVQLGSFSSRDNAQRLAKQLKGKGYSAYVLGGGGSSGKLYRVRVGPAPDKPAASALAAKLRAAGHTGSVVSQP